MGYCLSPEILVPFVFIIPGLWIQHFISFFTASKGKKEVPQHDDGEQPKESQEETGCKYSLKQLLKDILILYQIFSFIYEWVLQIIAMINYSEGGASGWHRYNCYAMLLINSSNYKRAFSNILAMAVLFNEKEKKEKSDANRMEAAIAGTEKTKQTEEEQETADTTKKVEDAGRTEASIETTDGNTSTSEGIKTIIAGKGIVYVALISLVLIWVLAFFPIIYTHMVPSLIFGWIILGLLCVVVPLSMLLSMLLDCCNAGPIAYRIFGVMWFKHLRKSEWNDMIISACQSPLIFSALYASLLCQITAISYMYQGDSYWEALTAVLTERKIDLYFEGKMDMIVFVASMF